MTATNQANHIETLEARRQAVAARQTYNEAKESGYHTSQSLRYFLKEAQEAEQAADTAERLAPMRQRMSAEPALPGHCYAYTRHLGIAGAPLSGVGMVDDDKRQRWAELFAGKADDFTPRQDQASDIICFLPGRAIDGGLLSEADARALAAQTYIDGRPVLEGFERI